jgi:hypothetical protein
MYYFVPFSYKKYQKYCLWIWIRDPDSEYGSTEVLESVSNADPQP